MSFFKLDGSGHSATSFAVHKSTASGKKAAPAKAAKASKPSPKVSQAPASELDESQFTKF